MRSNSKNHLLDTLERKPSFLDFWHRRCLDSLVRKPVQQAGNFLYRATLVLMMCTPTYGASNIGKYRLNDSFTAKLNPYRATPRIQSDLHVGDVPFSRFARERLPRKRWKNCHPGLRLGRCVLQDLSRAVSCFSRGPVAGNHVITFSIPLGQTRLQTSKRFFRSDGRL